MKKLGLLALAAALTAALAACSMADAPAVTPTPGPTETPAVRSRNGGMTGWNGTIDDLGTVVGDLALGTRDLVDNLTDGVEDMPREEQIARENARYW